MKERAPGPSPANGQTGLSYVELLVAVALIALVLVPALDALRTGMLGTGIFETSSAEYYAATGRMEELLAEPHGVLLAAAEAAGGPLVPSSYSDPPTEPNRRLVYLALYDADDADGDNDVFTLPDPDLDGDSNPFTGFDGLVWVRVEIDGSVTAFDSLKAP